MWKSHDDHPVLLLYKDGDQHMIRDSRSGELKEYPITAVSARILNLMAETKRIGDVNKEFTNGSSIDAAKEIAIRAGGCYGVRSPSLLQWLYRAKK